MKKKEILKIENMSLSFLQENEGNRPKEMSVITDLSVSVGEGEVVGVIGASGSGKSLLAHAIMGILPSNAKMEGNFYFKEENLTKRKIKKLQGKEIALVPQSVNYLDPLMKVGKQVRNGKKDKKTLMKQRELFQKYGLKEETENLYPFECSGGMVRRILLCTALMEEPALIIADEPTPGLDIDLAKRAMKDFRKFADEGKAVLLITHDLDLALEVADRIVIFYEGKTVEEVSVAEFEKGENLRHFYTKALWSALPKNRALPKKEESEAEKEDGK